jgi:hypothetical protein
MTDEEIIQTLADIYSPVEKTREAAKCAIERQMDSSELLEGISKLYFKYLMSFPVKTEWHDKARPTNTARRY